jgi:hypothetical protein
VLTHALLANTKGGKDCYNDRGHMAAALNLIESSEGCTGIVSSADPNLGPL